MEAHQSKAVICIRCNRPLKRSAIEGVAVGPKCAKIMFDQPKKERTNVKRDDRTEDLFGVGLEGESIEEAQIRRYETAMGVLLAKESGIDGDKGQTGAGVA